MGRQAIQTEFHRLFCTQCGNEGIPIIRRMGKQRASLHLKKMHCVHCNANVNHVEISPFGLYQESDFEKDFTLGKFKREK